MSDILQNVKKLITFILVDNLGTEVTGLGTSFTVQISKNGGALASGTGDKAEIGLGWYSYELTTTDTNTVGPLAITVTGAGAIQQNLTYDVAEALQVTTDDSTILILTDPDAAINYRQVYCTVEEIFSDLETPGGDVDAVLDKIQSASQTILQDMGNFLPIAARKILTGNDQPILSIPALLTPFIVDNDDTILASDDYLLGTREWNSGPYTTIKFDPDGSYYGAYWISEPGSVRITGRWGKYENVVDTGLTVDAGGLDDADLTLVTSNGASISPGMILRVEGEDIFVSGLGSPTAGVTEIDAAMDASQDTMTVKDGTKLNIGEIIRVGLEKMKVLDIATNTVSVQRAYHKTRLATHADDADVDVYRTPVIERAVNAASLPASHAAGKKIYQLVPPANINQLCRKLTILSLEQAKSKYSGRQGNSQTGQTMYFDAIPRWEYERIQAQYRIVRI
jgi:hypothetical protein